MIWTLLHPKMTAEHLGFIPSFLDEDDPASAREQINKNYAHGGGWSSFNGFERGAGNSLTFKGDPPMRPVASTKMRDETILVYPDAWVMIIDANGAWDVARLD